MELLNIVIYIVCAVFLHSHLSQLFLVDELDPRGPQPPLIAITYQRRARSGLVLIGDEIESGQLTSEAMKLV